MLKDRTEREWNVLLIYTGFADAPRTGSVNPFSHTALVVDQPNESDEKNAIRLAHELAHCSGAPTEDKPVGELDGRTRQRSYRARRAIRWAYAMTLRPASVPTGLSSCGAPNRCANS